MSVQTKTRDNALHDIFVTALEGGIGYWSQATSYRWALEDGLTEDLHGFRAVIVDVEQQCEPGEFIPDYAASRVRMSDGSYRWKYEINSETISRGVTRYIAYVRSLHSNVSEYWRKAAVDLDWGHWDDLDIDAEIADAIVQLALFDEIVFG